MTNILTFASCLPTNLFWAKWVCPLLGVTSSATTDCLSPPQRHKSIITLHARQRSVPQAMELHRKPKSKPIVRKEDDAGQREAERAGNFELEQLTYEANPAQQLVAESVPSDEQQMVSETDVSDAQQMVSETDVSDAQQMVPETDPSESQQMVPEMDPSESQQMVPETDPSESQQMVPETDPSESQQMVPETDPSESQQMVPETDPSESQQISETDLSESQQMVPETDPSDAQQMVPETDPSESQQMVPETDPSETQKPVSEADPSHAQRPVAEPVPPDAQQPVSETDPSEGQVVPEAAQRQQWSLIISWARCMAFLKRIPWILLIRWLLTITIVILFLTALLSDQWRMFLVNREALLNMKHTGEIDPFLLSSTVTMTRSQGIYKECYIDTSSHAANERDFLMKSGCQSIFYESGAPPHVGKYEEIFIRLQILQYLGPAVIFMSCFVLILQAFSQAYSDEPQFFLMLNKFGLGVVNMILAVFFFFIAHELAKYFQATDPGYPISWPSVVHSATEVEIWRMGPIKWAIGMLFQFLVLVIDLWTCGERQAMALQDISH